MIRPVGERIIQEAALSLPSGEHRFARPEEVGSQVAFLNTDTGGYWGVWI